MKILEFITSRVFHYRVAQGWSIISAGLISSNTSAQIIEVGTDCPCEISVLAYSWADPSNPDIGTLSASSWYYANLGSTDELLKITFTISTDPGMFLSWGYNVPPELPFSQTYGPVECDGELSCINLQGGRAYVGADPPYEYQFKVTCGPPLQVGIGQFVCP